MRLYVFNKETLQYQRISLKTYIYTLIIIGFIFTSLGFTGAIKFNNFVERIPIIIKPNQEQLTKEYVILLLNECNIQNKDIVLQQILLESSNLTSKSCKEGKNLTGMKKVYSRQNCQSGEFLGHARYNSYRECILDYALFQSNYCNNLTKEQYYSFLNQFYAEDPNYVNKLKQMK